MVSREKKNSNWIYCISEKHASNSSMLIIEFRSVMWKQFKEKIISTGKKKTTATANWFSNRIRAWTKPQRGEKMRHQFLRANSLSHSSMSSRVTFTSKLMHGNYTAVMVRG